MLHHPSHPPTTLLKPEVQKQRVEPGKPSPGHLLTQQHRALSTDSSDTQLRSTSPSGGLGSSEWQGKCRGSGSEGQQCTLPAPSSAHPYCGRMSGSHCSPSPRYRGTHAAERTELLLLVCRSLRGSDQKLPSSAWSEPQCDQDLSQPRQQSHSFSAELGMEGRTKKPRLIVYAKLLLN